MHHQRTAIQPPRASRRTAPEDHAYAVMNTVRALERFALGPRSVPELAAELGIGERSARRLVRRLATEGYVRQGGGHHRRYAATLLLAALGRELVDHVPLTRVAGVPLERLAHATRARAQLWIPSRGALVCLLDVDGDLDRPAAVPVLGAVARSVGDLTATVRERDEPVAVVALAAPAPRPAPDAVLRSHVRAAAATLSAALR